MPLLYSRLVVLLLFALSLPSTAQYRPPKPESTRWVSLGQGLSGADLERLKLGHQAGVLKVLGGDDTTVKFIKGSSGIGGIDGREWAPLSPLQRDQIITALRIEDPNAMASSLMANYTRISRSHALALLGVLAYPGEDTAPLKPELGAKVLQFQRDRLQPNEDNTVRRQAVVALAIQPKTDKVSVQAMLNFLRRDENVWNTFGVVQFFEYHTDEIRSMVEFQGFLVQLMASPNPHAEQILQILKADSSSVR